MSDDIFHLLHQWEEPSLWECLLKWDQQHRAQLEYAHAIPFQHKDERFEAFAIADKYAELMSAKFGELLAVREAVEQIAPDLAGPLDVRGPAEIASPIDRAYAVRDLSWKLKARLHASSANAVPSTGMQQGEGGTPPAVDPFADLRQFARSELKGQERAVIEALCDAGGELLIVDLAAKDGVGWDDEFQGFKDLQRRLNPKIKAKKWEVRRQNNSAILKALKRR